MRWLGAALDRGDLLTAWTTAHELPRGTLSLDYALALVVLASTGDPDRAERAAARLITRVQTERPDVDTGELAAILDALPDLLAVTQLGELCERHHWPRAAATLDHLVPGAAAPARRGSR